MRQFCFFRLLTALLLATGVAQAATDLGTLGGDYTEAHGINARGQVVGRSMTTMGNLHAFLWNRGVMTDLLAPWGVTGSFAFDISDSGFVVGALSPSPTTPGAQAYVWRDGNLTILPTLGSRPSFARYVNERGQVAGDSATVTEGQHPFFWDRGVMVDLGTLGGESGRARALSDSGVVVGDSRTAEGHTRAFLWQGGMMTDLGTLGGTSSAARDVNERGDVAGGALNEAGEGRAVLWRNGEPIDLGVRGLAFSVNERGQVVGGMLVDGGSRPFFWDRGELIDLGTLGGTTGVAYTINDRGQVRGVSRDAAGDTYAFVWQDGVMTKLWKWGGNPSQRENDGGLNNRGQLMGQCETPTGEIHACLWE